MLLNASTLHGYSVHAVDGEIGHVNQVYFDEKEWTVRYLVVDTGNWLTGRSVLISNYSIGEADHSARKLFVKLTREQVQGAPDAGAHPPLTRQWETAYNDYYSFPYYWDMAGYGMGGYGLSAFAISVAAAPAPDTQARSEQDAFLQSTADVTGFTVEATDGQIGHVADFIVDDTNWTIRYIEVDTGHWWPGKKVLVAPAWLREVYWPRSEVQIDLAREVIAGAPAYAPGQLISPEYEIELLDYYGVHHKDALAATAG